MKRLSLFCVIFFAYSVAICQKQNNQWILSQYLPTINHSFIDFNSGNADTLTVQSDIRLSLTNASICDTNGNLLFYTNGNVIFNRNHDTLLNGAGINPGWLTNYYLPNGMSVPQGSLILPRPGFSDQYYVFYVSGEPCPVGGGIAAQPINLPYSLIDINLGGGLGGIMASFKDVHAYDDTLVYGRLTATKHANGRDWWLVTHKSNSDIYNILLITPDTMILQQQQIGRIHNYEKFFGEVSFSPQGDKYVMILTADTNIQYGGIVDLLDFDRCIGLFSNERHVVVPDSLLLTVGCSFSPNGRWLYVNNNAHIFQYDTWNASINSSTTLIATYDTASNLDYKFLFQMLAPDEKIYITNLASADYLHVINYPDSAGVSCDVSQGSFHLPVVNSFSTPNLINYSLGTLTGSPCDTLTGIIEANNISLFTISPNPLFGRNIKINYSLSNWINLKLEIFDVNGKLIYLQILSSSMHEQEIFLPVMPGGIYSCIITSGIERAIRKLVVIRE